jgi:hypothetical protein
VKECNKREKERDKIRDEIRAGKGMGKERIRGEEKGYRVGKE